LGRILVEVMALIAGFTVLFVVAIWKALNILAAYICKLFGWVSNVRMLGHWAFVRARAVLLAVRRMRLSEVARLFAQRFSRIVAAIRARFHATRGVTVKSANVADDDIEIEIEPSRIPDANTNTNTKPKRNLWPIPIPISIPIPRPRGPRLILLRHAKSLWDIAGPDHERSLSAAGEAEARSIGRELSARGWHYDSVLCSNSRRTVQTLALLKPNADVNNVNDVNNTVNNVKMTEGLYFAVSADEMADVVDDEAAPGDCRLIVAHSPGIDELVERLTGTKPEMGTACAALLEYRHSNSNINSNSNSNDDKANASYSLKNAMHAWNLVDIVCPVPVEK